MDLLEYQKQSRNTWKNINISNPSTYIMLGLANEVGELADKFASAYVQDVKYTAHTREELKGELGDVLWYFTQLVTDFNFDLLRFVVLASPPVSPPEVTLMRLQGSVGRLLGVYKKIFRDHDGWINERKRNELANALSETGAWFCTFCACYDYTVNEIAEANLTKVLSRLERNVLHGEGDNR